MPLIVAAFLIFTALCVAQGSATVALTTTAGLLARIVTATVLSHVNDSGFWLVGLGVIGFAFALVGWWIL